MLKLQEDMCKWTSFVITGPKLLLLHLLCHVDNSAEFVGPSLRPHPGSEWASPSLMEPLGLSQPLGRLCGPPAMSEGLPSFSLPATKGGTRARWQDIYRRDMWAQPWKVERQGLTSGEEGILSRVRAPWSPKRKYFQNPGPQEWDFVAPCSVAVPSRWLDFIFLCKSLEQSRSQQEMADMPQLGVLKQLAGTPQCSLLPHFSTSHRKSLATDRSGLHTFCWTREGSICCLNHLELRAYIWAQFLGNFFPPEGLRSLAQGTMKSSPLLLSCAPLASCPVLCKGETGQGLL